MAPNWGAISEALPMAFRASSLASTGVSPRSVAASYRSSRWAYNSWYTASRAVMVFHDDYHDDTQDAYYFWFRVDVTGLAQWARLKDIPIHDFWAVDSLGNTYCSYKNGAYSYQRSVSGNLERTGYFRYTMDLWLTNFCSQDAQWIELRYDRDGRDIRLRIELNGGDSP